jgi:hypothetical protein
LSDNSFGKRRFQVFMPTRAELVHCGVMEKRLRHQTPGSNLGLQNALASVRL